MLKTNMLRYLNQNFNLKKIKANYLIEIVLKVLF